MPVSQFTFGICISMFGFIAMLQLLKVAFVAYGFKFFLNDIPFYLLFLFFYHVECFKKWLHYSLVRYVFWLGLGDVFTSHIYMCVCIYKIYICIYIYSHTDVYAYLMTIYLEIMQQNTT